MVKNDLSTVSSRLAGGRPYTYLYRRRVPTSLILTHPKPDPIQPTLSVPLTMNVETFIPI